jgi:hypothetical protein
MRRTLLATLAAASVFSISTLASTAHAGPEVDVRIAYGSAGKSSPVAYEPPAGGAIVGLPVGDTIYGVPNQTAEPYGGGLIAQLSMGFRFIPFMSAGFSGGIRKASASAPDGTYSNNERSAWEIGPYLRGYIPLVPFIDPWIGIGVEYMSDTQKYSRSGVDWTLSHNGVAVPITIGIDYVALPLLKIGPSFQYTTVFPAGGCFKGNAPGAASFSTCSDATPQFTHPKGYNIWSIGLNARLSL